MALIALFIAVGVGGAALATDWFGADGRSTGCPIGITLEGAGASFPVALESQWATGYATATGNLVNYEPSGAGQGISLLTEKQKDFALTDEPLNGSEASGLVGAVGTVLTLPVTGGAVTVVYNVPGYHGPLNLTVGDLVAIYVGTITRWDDPGLLQNNSGLGGITTPIVVVHRGDAAGMSYVLTEFLSEVNATWAGSVGVSVQPAWPAVSGALNPSGNSALITDVKGTPGAIGYTDLYDAEEHGLSIAGVRDRVGQFVVPSVASAQSAVDDVYNASPGSIPPSSGDWSAVSWVDAPGSGDYPLATLVYALIPESASRGFTASSEAAVVLVQWLHYVLTTGQSFDTVAFPYIDPPPPLVTEALAALSNVTYMGAPVASCA